MMEMMDAAGTALDYAVDWVASYWPSLALLALALLLPRPAVRAAGRTLRRVATHRAGPWIALPAISLIAAAAAGWVGGLPLPVYQDDYSYLLSADTFLSGRLTNPAHPLWPHFETFYTLMQPTYASKYPPAQGLVLALGQAVSGIAISGMWLAAAAMTASFYWMFLGWVPRRWALLGAAIVAIHPTTIAWSQSFHGGNIPALASALLVGSIPRLGSPRSAMTASVAAAAALVILANSRPYEGLVVAVLVAGLALITVRPLRAVRIVPGLIVLAAGAAATLLYNNAVLGTPLQLPFRHYDLQYASAPDFIWQDPYPERQYRQRDMEVQYALLRNYYLREREPEQFWSSAIARVQAIGSVALGKVPIDTTVAPDRFTVVLRGLYAAHFLPLLALPVLIRRRGPIRLLLPVALLFLCALLQVTWWPQSHYPAAGAAIFAALYVELFRILWSSWQKQRWGSKAAIAALAAFLAAAVYSWVHIAHWNPGPGSAPALRDQVQRMLLRSPGADLVIVDRDIHDVVFNDADIDRSPVVWAHSLDDDSALRRHFSERRIWRLEEDEGRPRLIPEQ
jgi:hypothetical protein